VSILSDENTYIDLQVDAKRDALVVLNDSAFPGWEAMVDGKTTEIIRTNEIVRGVAVKAGEHLVTFRYRPQSVRRGTLISAMSLLTMAAVALAGRGLRRRSSRR